MRDSVPPESRSWRWRNVPVPEAHLGLTVAGVAAQRLRPWHLEDRAVSRRAGWALLGVGVTLTGSATRAAQRTDLARPDRLVTAGPYGVSRNPMYVGWTAMYAGAALVRGAVWPLLFLPVLLSLVDREVRREEARLAVVFGAEYDAYRARVRRYV